MPDNNEVRCSFCGKPEQSVERMLHSARANICDGCVALCYDMLVEEFPGTRPLPRGKIRPLRRGSGAAEAHGDEGGPGPVRHWPGQGEDRPVRGGLQPL